MIYFIVGRNLNFLPYPFPAKQLIWLPFFPTLMGNLEFYGGIYASVHKARFRLLS